MYVCGSVSVIKQKRILAQPDAGLGDNKHSGYPFLICYFGGGLGHNQSVNHPSL